MAEGPIELAFVGSPNDPGLQALQLAVREVFLPHRVIASSEGTGTPSGHPLLAGKGLVEGKAALYICRNFSCQRPLTDPLEVTEASAVGVATNGSADPTDTLARNGAPRVGQSRGDSQVCRAYRESVTP